MTKIFITELLAALFKERVAMLSVMNRNTTAILLLSGIYEDG
jgi:hypothetical protein